MIPKYIDNWLKVIEEMNNDNTYKLAWGRGIIECIISGKYQEHEGIAIVTFDDISYCMLKYYWNQIFFFNLKQCPYKTKEPVICKDTKKLIEEYKLKASSNLPAWFDEGYKVLNKNSKCLYEKIIEHISKTLHENVCWRFKNTPSGQIELYEYNKGISKILFKKDEITLLKDYGIVISKLLNYKWAQLLEKFNYAPKIASKVNSISESKIRRNNLTKYKDELIKQFKGGPIIDFYTGKEIDYKDISVDHVIPWSFMYSDDIWNLVITNKSTNSSKSNSIPTEEVIDKLNKRNEELINVVDEKYKLDLEEALLNHLVDKCYLDCRI